MNTVYRVNEAAYGKGATSAPMIRTYPTGADQQQAMAQSQQQLALAMKPKQVPGYYKQGQPIKMTQPSYSTPFDMNSFQGLQQGREMGWLDDRNQLTPYGVEQQTSQAAGSTKGQMANWNDMQMISKYDPIDMFKSGLEKLADPFAMGKWNNLQNSGYGLASIANYLNSSLGGAKPTNTSWLSK